MNRQHELNEAAKPLTERKKPVDPLVLAGAVEYIDVVCLVLPNGENLWFEAAKGQDYMRQVIDKWKSEHTEFKDTPCTLGAVHITMPRKNYNDIGAFFGPGCFVWP